MPPLLLALVLVSLLLSLVSAQPPTGPSFVRVGPSRINPPTSWPGPREKGNAEWISLSTTFYDGNLEQYVNLTNYAVIYGGETNQGALLNDVWATADGLTWVWVAGLVGSSLHGRVPLTFPARSEVAHCQDRSFVQFRAAGRTPGLFNDVWRSTNSLNRAWVLASATAPWAPRYLASMTSDLSSGSIFIAGGILAAGGTTRATADDVWQSTDQGATWSRRYAGSSSGPGGRGVSLLLSDAPSQLLWLTGVNTGVSPSVYYADLWASSDAGTTWGAATTASAFGTRDDANGEVMGNGILVVTAGFREVGTQTETLNDVWMSVNGGWSWSQCVKDAEWDDRRYLMTLADPYGRLWIFGGSNNTADLNDVWVSTWSFYDRKATSDRCGAIPGFVPVIYPACGNGMKCYPTDPATVLTSPEALGGAIAAFGATLPWCPACPWPFIFGTWDL